MIDINLLPPEYAPKKLISLSGLAIISIFVLVSLSLLLSSFKLLAELQDYSGRAEYHDQQIRHFAQQVEDIRELKKRVKLLKARLSLVKELLEEKTAWSDELTDLSQYLPQNGIWIDGLTIDRQKVQRKNFASATNTGKSKNEDVETEQIMVEILGSVVSVDKVSQFVANLEESKTFGNVVFDSATSSAVGPAVGPRSSEGLISFKLTVEFMDS
jgi:Tfp pilus assembly protein PilN